MIKYGVYVVIVTIFCDNRCPKSFVVLKLALTRSLVRGAWLMDFEAHLFFKSKFYMRRHLLFDEI